MNNAMPYVPKGQENFFYASKTCLWIFFKVELEILQTKINADFQKLGLEIATFEDKKYGYVTITPMIYTALFGEQDAKEKRPGVAGITEAEFNILVYPTSQKDLVPEITFKEFILGQEQQKIIGQYRLAVVCDHMGAVHAGREKYGEHKFPGNIDYKIDTYNNNSTEGKAMSFYFKAYPVAGSPDDYIFSLNVNLEGSLRLFSDFSPVVVYGAIPPEPQKNIQQKVVGSRRNYLGMCKAYFPKNDNDRSVKLEYGLCSKSPVLNDSSGIPIENSPNWAQEMNQMMKVLLHNTSTAGLLSFESPPAVTEPRPYYVKNQAP